MKLLRVPSVARVTIPTRVLKVSPRKSKGAQVLVVYMKWL